MKTSGKTPPETSGKTSGKIVELMLADSSITIPELAEALAISTRAVEMQIRKLKENEVIGRIDGAKGGHWEVLK